MHRNQSLLIIVTLVFLLLGGGTGSLKSILETGRDFHVEQSSNWIVFFYRKCLVNAGNPIVLAGNINKKMTVSIHRSMKTTIILFTEPVTTLDQIYSRTKGTSDFYDKRHFRYQSKAGGFLVAAKSRPVLGVMIDKLKSSRWWNHSALFIIIGEESDNHGCHNAYSFLWTAWQAGMLSAVYLCREKETAGLTLFAYHPFRDHVPTAGWERVASYAGRNGHPWTLFRRQLDEITEKTYAINCGEILFEKTANLNGYPVRVNAMNISPKLTFSTMNEADTLKVHSYSGEDGWLASTLWSFLNVTLIHVPYNGNWGMGFTEANGSHFGMKADIASGRVDIGLNQRYVQPDFGLGTTYPHISASYCFMTKSKENVPFLVDLTRGMNWWIGLLTLGSALVLTLLLDCLEGRGYRYAWLNVLRIVISNSLIRPPRRFSARLLFLGGMLVCGTMNVLFQGKMSALVAKPRSYENIETLDELEKFGFDMHGFISFKKFIWRDRLRERFVDSQDDLECFKRVIDGLPIACAGHCINLWEQSKLDNRFHVAEELILRYYSYYLTRTDWPLLQRVDVLISRMVSAGLPNIWRRFTLWNVKVRTHSIDRNSSYPETWLVKLNDLHIFFYAYMMALFFALLVFAIELVCSRWMRRK
ncbi:uncharacterized protein LOC124295337 [Neodiprion lecontei]|uniref:Uncharacterized protein LOC124295337 n=1 Tax=Neodiprion lecontei TaxID=441921 RepID=A0ABM3GKX9_NEOLC|nr:uncharacterized protein LOC124295337 [Neodiprion lecontei]